MKWTHALRGSLLASLGLLPMACGAETGGTTDRTACTGEKLDESTGLLVCNEGYRHRKEARGCEVTSTVGAADGLPRANGGEECEEDADCAGFALGYCDSGLFSVCESGCASDDDCGKGYLCRCDGPSPHGGSCVPADCRTDDDCEQGRRCASYAGICDSGGFQCQSPDDECNSSDDCEDGTCTVSDGHRVCDSAVCGRPFLVESAARLPPVTGRGDWRDSLTPRVDHLSARQRAALAQHWAKLGQMEHASIAAFARFQLQLLALGAPPELVEQCTQALADETAHTKLCFGLASAYAGRALGPGPLDVSRSLDEISLLSVVDLVLVEGCFGETSAALEALEAAETAADPVIRDAYARIAQDEQRHAELAFRFLKWALEQERDAVAERVALALGAAPPAVADVAVPCLEALVARPRAA